MNIRYLFILSILDCGGMARLEVSCVCNRDGKVDKKKVIIFGVFMVIEFVLVVSVVILINWIFHNPFCNFLFSCGCTWNWEGGWDECNVHSTDPNQPKCPWCMASPSVAWTTEWGVEFCMIAAYYIVSYWWIAKWAYYSLKNQNDTTQNLKYEEEENNVDSVLYISFFPSPVNMVFRVVSPFIAFVVASLVVGFAFYISSDYPVFLFGTP